MQRILSKELQPSGLPPLFHPEKEIKNRVKNGSKACWIYLLLQLGCSSVLSFILFAIFGFINALVGDLLLSSHEFALYNAFNAWSASVYDVLYVVILLIVTLVSAIGAIQFIKSKYPNLICKPSFEKRFSWPDFLKAMCFMFLASLVCSYIIYFFDLMFHGSSYGADSEMLSSYLDGGALSAILTFITVCLITPVLEEYFFRGCLLQIFKNINPLFALLFSSFCFALMHMNFSQGLPTFFMGIVLGVCALKTNSIALPIYVHAANNIIAVLSSVGMLETALSVLVWIAAIAGLVLLIKNWKRIRAFWQRYKPFCSIKDMFSSVWMITFIVFFLVYAIGNAFL